MNEKESDGPCEKCGYSNDAPYLPSYLAPGTILNDRYIVGKLLSYNGEGATYIGFDRVQRSPSGNICRIRFAHARRAILR